VFYPKDTSKRLGENQNRRVENSAYQPFQKRPNMTDGVHPHIVSRCQPMLIAH
jgi:hypothetical protein